MYFLLPEWLLVFSWQDSHPLSFLSDIFILPVPGVIQCSTYLEYNLFPSYWPQNRLILLSRHGGKILGLQAHTLDEKAATIMDTRLTSVALENVFIKKVNLFWQYIIVCILENDRALWTVMIHSTVNLQGALQTGTDVSSTTEIFELSVDWCFQTLERNMITVVQLVNLLISTAWPHLSTPNFVLLFISVSA